MPAIVWEDSPSELCSLLYVQVHIFAYPSTHYAKTEWGLKKLKSVRGILTDTGDAEYPSTAFSSFVPHLLKHSEMARMPLGSQWTRKFQHGLGQRTHTIYFSHSANVTFTISGVHCSKSPGPSCTISITLTLQPCLLSSLPRSP